MNDTEQILALHRQWWKANVGFDVPKMREVFAPDDAFFMFNRNGHVYYGVDELTKLWEWLNETRYSTRTSITVDIQRFEIRGDMAWLASEATSNMKDDPRGAVRTSRGTEVYQRELIDGERVWRMWHFHSSELLPTDVPRIPDNDVRTAARNIPTDPAWSLEYSAPDA